MKTLNALRAEYEAKKIESDQIWERLEAAKAPYLKQWLAATAQETQLREEILARLIKGEKNNE